jgi:Na+/H+-dicarboxylate symporter
MGEKKNRLTLYIALGLALGIAAGVLLSVIPENAGAILRIITALGEIYLNLIKTLVVPVVTLSIIAGVISLGEIKKIGTIGTKAMLFYLVTTGIAVTLGLLLANGLHVAGGFVMPETVEAAPQAQKADFLQTLVGIFPDNILTPFSTAAMLPVIILSLLIGLGILLAGEKGRTTAAGVESLCEVFLKIMGLIIRLSPIGVFALITPVVAQQGIGVLLPLGKLAAVVYLAYALHTVTVYALSVRLFGKISPRRFFRQMRSAMLFAFSSASSVGTLPLNMQAASQLEVDKQVSSFVLPLGATVNMDGTAIYQGVCAVFIAQVYGIDLGLSQQLAIVLTAVLASLGTAGVPGGGVIMLSMVLQSAGLPLEGVGLIYGIDRILDMGRTVVNITGDAACCVCVNAWERRGK